jgi:hypothetical protein
MATVGNNLRRLLQQAKGDSSKPQSFVLARGGALPRPKGVEARLIEYGFKAPVAMTLNPFWHELLPNFRFLHVVRDGRDIAFSANQGPVDKFYRAMYSSSRDLSLPKQVKAVKLWSDWNVQIHDWSKEQIRRLDDAFSSSSKLPFRGVSGDKDKALGYFLIHTEDLVSPARATKLRAMSQLADWVGSTISEDDLCCLATLDSEFMGSHDSNKGGTVSKRYGKWRAAIANDRDLGNRLHEEGKAGLELFGYLDDSERNKLLDSEESANVAVLPSGYVCRKTPVECGAPEPPKPVNIDTFANKKPILDGLCDLLPEVDFKGPDLVAAGPDKGQIMTGDSSAERCCRLCQADHKCAYFTLDNSNGVCYLKSTVGTVSDSHKTLVSGIIHRK